MNIKGMIAVVGMVLGIAAGGWTMMSNSPAMATEMTVWKTPWCGCCTAWVQHMRQSGFVVSVTEMDDLAPIKRMAGVPETLQSCHTAKVEGYTIEGHVPADDVMRLLEGKPSSKGLAVPGMPIGSPGMEQGGRTDPYDVIMFGGPGGDRIFASH